MSRVTVHDDGVGVRDPWLVRPFQAGMTGWIVVFGAIIVELAGGALTYSKFVGAVLPVLMRSAFIADLRGVLSSLDQST